MRIHVLCGNADAGVDRKHAEIDRIAHPAVDARRHQGACRMDAAHRRSRPREVTSARDRERQTGEDEQAADNSMDRLRSGKRERQAQQGVEDKTGEQGGEKEKRRPRDNAGGCAVG